MTRAMFGVTVRNENGTTTTYCANHLHVYDGQSGRQSLAFLCSGRLTTVPVADVVEVKLSDGWSHCNECDNPVANLNYYPGEPAKQQA